MIRVARQKCENQFFYTLSRTRPATMKRIIANGVVRELGEDYDIVHFTPRYNAWDQRLCLVPDSKGPEEYSR